MPDSKLRNGQRSATRHYAPVRSCQRAFAILEVINARRCVEIKDIVSACGLPRATVVRLLETLVDAEYVSQNERTGAFSPAPRVLALANGFHFEHWLEAVSTPILDMLLARIGWPSDLMFLNGDRMVARASNRAKCPFEVKRDYVGVGGPLAYSAAGRAYLAFCGELERDRLLHQSAPLRDHKQIRTELERTALRGYSVRDPALTPKLGAIGIPVLYGGSVACTLTCIFSIGISSTESVAERSLDPMREAAQLLSKAWERQFSR